MIKLFIRLKNLKTYICKHNWLPTSFTMAEKTQPPGIQMLKCRKCGAVIWRTAKDVINKWVDQ